MAAYFCSILHTTIILFFVKCVGCLDDVQDNNAEGFFNLIAAWPPIWRTTYTFRLLGTNNDEALDHFRNPGETPPEFVYIAHKLTKRPWNYIDSGTSFLGVYCINYRNLVLGRDVNNGQLGNYTLLLSFRFEGCLIDHLSQNAFRGLTRLKGIFLKHNGLKSISLRAFDDCPDLLWLDLEGSTVKSLSIEHFCNNPNLAFLQIRGALIDDIEPSNSSECEALSINSLVLNTICLHEIKPNTLKPFAVYGVLAVTNSSIKWISRSSFEGLGRTLDLDLEMNEICHLEQNVFDAMKINLQKISLSRNRLTNITITNVFDTLNISYLLLDNNLIQKVYGNFSDIHKMQHLDISCNKLKNINGLFKNMFSLKYLNVSSNFIDEIHYDDIKNTRKIEILDISNNRIVHIPDDIFSNLEFIKELRVRNNSISDISEDFCVKCERLAVLDVSQNNLNVSRLKISSNNLKFLDVSRNKFENIPKLIHINGTSVCYELETLNASKNHIKHFQIHCQLSLVTFQIDFNKIEFLPSFKKMTKLKTIHMRGNELQSIQKDVLCGEQNALTFVDFGENKINSIDKDAFEKCLKLEILLLDKNRLTTLFNTPSTLKTLKLSKNPIRCSCELKPFVDEITINKALHTDNITCLSTQGKEISIREADIQECVVNHTTQLIIEIVVPIGSVFLLLFILAFVIFKYRYEIEVIAFYKWNIRFRCCFRKKKQKTAFRYDAFVCFAEEDLNFVKDTLVALLEPRFRLCVYYRDFPVGIDIAEAILDVIDDSAVTMVLLSEAFLRSRWGNFEFRHAHHNSMQNEDQKLLVIVLEESVLTMELDLTLKSILFSKAYLKKNDRLFNEKLLHAMPEKASENKENGARNEQQRLID